MPVELCSESTSGLVLSPRISFSHDLSQSDVVPVEQHLLRSDSSSGIDFDFCISESYDHESSSADELFSDGKILPIQIKKKTIPTKQITQSELRTTSRNTDNGCQGFKETKATSSNSDEKQNSKSFWPFKRSSSLNCGSGYARTLCPLPLLSRSNSTGSSSAGSSKKTPSSLSKEQHQTHKQNSQKNQYSGSYQKPPLKKSYGSYGNGTVRVNPVLNVPSGNLFGLGSIFFNGKEKEKNKKK